MLKPEQGTESKQPFGNESGAKAGANSRPITKRFLIVLGQNKKWWKDILILLKEQERHFDAINPSTNLAQLGLHVREDDPLFIARQLIEREIEYGRSCMNWRGLGVSKHSPCNCKEGVELKLERDENHATTGL